MFLLLILHYQSQTVDQSLLTWVPLWIFRNVLPSVPKWTALTPGFRKVLCWWWTILCTWIEGTITFSYRVFFLSSVCFFILQLFPSKFFWQCSSSFSVEGKVLGRPQSQSHRLWCPGWCIVFYLKGEAKNCDFPPFFLLRVQKRVHFVQLRRDWRRSVERQSHKRWVLEERVQFGGECEDFHRVFLSVDIV